MYNSMEEAEAAIAAEAMGGEGADRAPSPASLRGEGELPIHSDQGAVSVTLWLVEAPEGEEAGGGMRLYQAAAPSASATGSGDVGRVDIDSSAAAYPEVSAQCRASRHDEIQHAPNRMAIFNADLYHMTLPGRAKPGFEGRRIALTLLFGTRCGEEKVHGTQTLSFESTEAKIRAAGLGHKIRRS